MSRQSSMVARGIVAAAIATSAFLLADMAYGAGPVTQTLNMPVSETVSAGQALPDTINLAQYMSNGSQNFELSDFVLTVTGSPPDVGGYSLVTNPYVLYAINEVYTSHGYIYDYYYNRNVSEVDTDGESDGISVTVGADQQTSYNSLTSTVGPYLETGETVSGSPSFGQSFYITNTNIVVNTYGSLVDALQISAATANALDQTKELTYDIKDLIGTTNISDVSLSFLQTPIVSPAPEPATWLMMLVGVGMVGVMIRKQPKLKASK